MAYAPKDVQPIIPHLTPYGVDNVLHPSQFWAPQNRGPINAPSYQRPPGGIRQAQPNSDDGNKGFLGKGITQTQPSPEIVSLQVQMKQLTELVKQVLNVPLSYQRESTTPLNQYWPPLSVPQNLAQKSLPLRC